MLRSMFDGDFDDDESDGDFEIDGEKEAKLQAEEEADEADLVTAEEEDADQQGGPTPKKTKPEA